MYSCVMRLWSIEHVMKFWFLLTIEMYAESTALEQFNMTLITFLHIQDMTSIIFCVTRNNSKRKRIYICYMYIYIYICIYIVLIILDHKISLIMSKHFLLFSSETDFTTVDQSTLFSHHTAPIETKIWKDFCTQRNELQACYNRYIK